MDLGHFTHGDHKHFINQDLGSNSVDDLINNVISAQNYQDESASPLLKLIKQSDVECLTLTPQSFYVKSDSQNQNHAVEPEQFSRFITYIESDTDKKCKAELSMFLYPVFIHSYLELLEKSSTEDAYSFINQYKGLFAKNAKYLQVIEDLNKVKQKCDIASFPNIKHFRENRYSLKISEKTFSMLESFFSKEINFPFLELIQSKIDLTISYSHELDSDPESESEDYSNPQPRIHEDADREFQVDYSRIPEYQRYLEAKKNVENVPPNPPALMAWTIHNLEEASCAEINSDGSLMLSASLNGQILVTRLVPPMNNDIMSVPINSVPLAALSHDSFTVRHIKKMTNMNVYGNKGAVHDVSFVPGSELFLSVSSDNYLRAYSLETYNCVMKYRGHDMTVWSVDACSKSLAVTSSRDTTARLWSLDQLYPVRIFVGHRQDVTCARFHPKVTYIGSGSYDKAVRLWSITDGSSVRVFANHESAVLSLAFSPCGKYLASGGEDGLVLIHELTSGRVLTSFHLTGQEPVTSLAWSMTGETVIAGSLTGSVQMIAWPSVAKIGAVEPSTIVTYDKVMDRVLNIQYKTTHPGHPICLGVRQESEQDIVVLNEQMPT